MQNSLYVSKLKPTKWVVPKGLAGRWSAAVRIVLLGSLIALKVRLCVVARRIGPAWRIEIASLLAKRSLKAAAMF